MFYAFMNGLFHPCLSFNLYHFPVFRLDHIKRKIRRRPSWGRGIIRKKKNYKKGTEEEEEEEEPEVEAAGPSDSCLTQDEESSCDTMGPQTNGHVPSTEEESSNEPPVALHGEPPNTSGSRKEPASKEEEPKAKEVECDVREKPSQPHCLGDSSQSKADRDNQDKQADVQPSTGRSSHPEAQSKHSDGLLVPQVDCVNGNESMDSVDSQSLKTSIEADRSTPHNTTEGSNDILEQDEHKDKNMSEPTQEHPPQDGRAVTEDVEEDQDKEGRKPDLKFSVLRLRSCLLIKT